MKKAILLTLLIVAVSAVHAQFENDAIRVEVSGKGAPVLLIPGFTVPGEVWQPLVSQLEENFECHVVTLAGFGGKAPIDFPWLPQVNQALEDYISDEGLTNLTIIGHSLGGTVAAWLASREDLPIEGIILVDALPAAGAIMFPHFNPDNLGYESPYNTQQLNMTDEQFAQMATAMAQGMSLNEAPREQIRDWILQSDRKTYVYGYTDYLKLDMREDLKKIAVPVTIIAAEQPFGKEMVMNTVESQYANLPDYDLIVVENSAHFIMLDQPEWFNEQIALILSPKQ